MSDVRDSGRVRLQVRPREEPDGGWEWRARLSTGQIEGRSRRFDSEALAASSARRLVASELELDLSPPPKRGT